MNAIRYVVNPGCARAGTQGEQEECRRGQYPLEHEGGILDRMRLPSPADEVCGPQERFSTQTRVNQAVMMQNSLRVALFAVVLAEALVIRTTHSAGNQERLGRIERLDPRFDALIPPGTVVEKVAEGIDWAEGPLWDSRNGVLLFSDVPRNGVFSVRPGGAVHAAVSSPAGTPGTGVRRTGTGIEWPGV